jgi:hypothetical protein
MESHEVESQEVESQEVESQERNRRRWICRKSAVGRGSLRNLGVWQDLDWFALARHRGTIESRVDGSHGVYESSSGLVADPQMYQNSTSPAHSLALAIQNVRCAMLPETGCPAR